MHVCSTTIIDSRGRAGVHPENFDELLCIKVDQRWLHLQDHLLSMKV